ncbi:hypothetical protein M513_01049, partial [Trichuris suis]
RIKLCDCLHPLRKATYSILEFFEEEASLCTNLKKFLGDIAYMSDLYVEFNKMNLQLQGNDLNLIKTKSVISAFVSKLLFFKNNHARGEFYNFPNLCEIRSKGQINAELQLQEELLKLQANEELNLDAGLSNCNATSHSHSQDWVENGFSVVADLLTKKRTKLQIVNRVDLRLWLTSIEPNVKICSLCVVSKPDKEVRSLYYIYEYNK